MAALGCCRLVDAVCLNEKIRLSLDFGRFLREEMMTLQFLSGDVCMPALVPDVLQHGLTSESIMNNSA